MSVIFISHSSQNNAEALAVAEWLKANGWGDFFLDVEPSQGLNPGERWQDALKQAADRCEAVVFLISPAWLASRWCLAEFLLAKQLGKVIFGVVIAPVSLDAIPREMTMEWQLCDLVAGDHRESITVAREPLVPATDVSFAAVGLTALRRGLQQAGLDPASFEWPPRKDPERAPYRGFKALEAEDAAVFFGREAAIVRGLDRLRSLRDQGVENLLLILGASGAGKSSFMRAGLLPRLARDDRHFLTLPVVRPERAVLSGATGLAASLEGGFKALGKPRSRARLLAAIQTPAGLIQALDELLGLAVEATLAREGPPPMLILPIDQGEELFAAEGHAEAEPFLSLLAHLLAPAAPEVGKTLVPRVLAVMTIRSESQDLLESHTTLKKVHPPTFYLKSMAPADLKAVIEGPAQRATQAGRKLEIDPRLTQELIEGKDGADVLPLLAFTLERLYLNHWADGRLTLENYEASGGLAGVVADAIEAVFVDPGRSPAVPADPAARDRALRAAFIPWLARIDTNTRAPKRRVAHWQEIPEGSRGVVERLIEQRLLLSDARETTPGQPATRVVEIAHEALLRQWPLLASWLNEEGDALRMVEALEQAAGEWKGNGRGEAWLVHKGTRLADAETLRDRPDYRQRLGDIGGDYLLACRRQEDEARARARREQDEREENLRQIAAQQRQTAKAQRRTLWVITATAIIVMVAGGWSFLQVDALALTVSTVLAKSALDRNKAGDVAGALRFGLLASSEQGRLANPVKQARLELARALMQGVFFDWVLRGHERSVNSAAFSPDGTRIVTASDDGTARVWQADGQGEPVVLKGHESTVNSAAFSPDGTRIVTASNDGTARIWRTDGQGEPVVLKGHEGWANRAVFSPDGTRIVTASDDGTARVWRADGQGEPVVLESHSDVVTSAIFSPDGARIFTSHDDGTARVWRADGQGEPVVLMGHVGSILSAAFSPDGTLILTASRDGTARVWRADGQGSPVVLKGGSGAVVSAAFSPDGARIVTASDDGTARVWWSSGQGEPMLVKGHEGLVRSVAFSPDGARILTASDDGTARVWQIRSQNEPVALKGHEKRVTSFAFSPNGAQIVTTSDDGTARVWRTDGLGEPVLLQGHSDVTAATIFKSGTRSEYTTLTASFSPDGTHIVIASTSSADGTARVWRTDGQGEPVVLRGHITGVTHAAFSSDGARIVTADGRGTARVWRTDGQGEPVVLRGHTAVVTHAAFSSDGVRIVTASLDGTARVWRADGQGESVVLSGHVAAVTHAAFSSDGARIVTASLDGTARVWRADGQGESVVLSGHVAGVTNAAFSPNGARILTDSSDGTVRVWRADGEVEMVMYKRQNESFVIGDPIIGTEGSKRSVHAPARAIFSPDGRSIVTQEDGTVLLWDISALARIEEPDLAASVCRETVSVAHILTAEDIRDMPILQGREGEDVCGPNFWLSQAWQTVARVIRAAGRGEAAGSATATLP